MSRRRLRLLTAVALGPLLAFGACSTGDASRPGSIASSTPAAPAAPASPDRASASARPTGTTDVLADAVRRAPRATARATSPKEVIAQLVAAENAIADRSSPRRVLAAAGHLQQIAYRELGARPGWDARVRALLPTRLLARVAANVTSRREFIALQGGFRSDTLPAWRIAPAEPMATLLRHYREGERRHGVDWEYLAAINLLETQLGRIRGTSVAGAQGPMQFIPSTWAAYGAGDIRDPRDAILGAANYLAANGFGRRGGRPGALFRYNNSERYVRGVTEVARTIQRHPRSFVGYYHWQVYYVTTRGDVRLPQGYDRTRPIRVERYLERHPRD